MPDDYDQALDLLEAATDHMTPLDLIRVGVALDHDRVHLTVTRDGTQTLVTIDPLIGPRSDPEPEHSTPNTRP